MCRIRHAGERHHAYSFALAFVIREEKRLILDDRTAYGRAELIVLERRLRLVVEIEIIARIQNVVAEIIEEIAVKIVGSALGDDINHRPAISPEFRLEFESTFSSLIESIGKIAEGVPNTPA